MIQNSNDLTGPDPMVPFAEATAYLAKLSVAAKDFPPDRLKRLQYLLTAEPDAGCRVWPDPTWDPNECQEACDEHFRQLDDLKAYIEAFRQGGVALAETTIAARQHPEPPKQPKPNPFFDPAEIAKYASKDRRTATERGLDFYREHLRQTNAQKAEDQPPQLPVEPRKDDLPE